MIDIKQYCYQEWGRMADTYRLSDEDFRRGYEYVRYATNTISNARVISDRDDPARLENEAYAIVDGAIQWATVQLLTELHYPQQSYSQYFPAYDAISAKLDQIESLTRQPDPRYQRNAAQPIQRSQPNQIYSQPNQIYRRPQVQNSMNDPLGTSRLSQILGANNMDISNFRSTETQFTAQTDATNIPTAATPTIKPAEPVESTWVDIPVSLDNTLSVAEVLALRSTQGADGITETIINATNSSEDTAQIVYKVEEVVINLSKGSSLDGFIELVSELRDYTSLYEAIIKLAKYKDVRLINFINNALNHFLSQEAFNRHNVIVPHQQFFVKWDIFQAFESDHGLLPLREVMMQELLTFFENLEILSESHNCVISRRVVPLVCVADLLTFLPSKKILVSATMNEPTYYKFCHNCFETMVKLGHKESTATILDRSLSMFEITEYGPHTLAPTTAYETRRIKQRL